MNANQIQAPEKMSLDEFASRLNEWGQKKIPFLFLVDFEMEKPLAFTLAEIDAEKLLFDINGRTNSNARTARYTHQAGHIDFVKLPISLDDYKTKFDKVHSRLLYGDSYLTNLTVKTGIRTTHSLREIFFVCEAKYKLLLEDHFIVFSPETFMRIEGGRIFSYPMKGTIDASVSGAMEKILADRKEMAEHVTIVDLIRNDLSTVSSKVEVTHFRYVEEIKTTGKNLLQVSSEIRGDLPPGYEGHLGDIVRKLLPAGSVSGAPKCKTLQIIREAENEPRGYYTGVVGIYDGRVLDSGVMIRFIESRRGQLYYRSGGGITAQSHLESEYQEAIDKVYVPVD